MDKKHIQDKCPLGGDITNDCLDCVYSTEYQYDEKTQECKRRK